MTREAAYEHVELLKLAIHRINREAENIRARFCKRGEHYFIKVWMPVKGLADIFVAIGYECFLCSISKPLLTGGKRCRFCNELLESYESIGMEDVESCSRCSFDSSQQNFLGAPRRAMSTQDRVEIK